jgi:hypothetical protein
VAAKEVVAKIVAVLLATSTREHVARVFNPILYWAPSGPRASKMVIGVIKNELDSAT